MKIKETALKYTYEDYLALEDDENRYELIDGSLYMMTMPSWQHQKISGGLFYQLYHFLKGKPCDVYHPPFDVRLSNNTVVQPDIMVVCDKSKLGDRGCKGAPDMIIEILSPSSIRHDTITKLNKYLQAGVREYWVVNPEDKIVNVHTLDDDKYITKVYSDEDTVAVHVLDGCVLDMREVFTEI